MDAGASCLEADYADAPWTAPPTIFWSYGSPTGRTDTLQGPSQANRCPAARSFCRVSQRPPRPQSGQETGQERVGQRVSKSSSPFIFRAYDFFRSVTSYHVCSCGRPGWRRRYELRSAGERTRRRWPRAWSGATRPDGFASASRYHRAARQSSWTRTGATSSGRKAFAL